MGAIARIEDVLTLKEIHDAASMRGTVKLARVASAYGAVLRYAGAKVTDEEIYSGMFGGEGAGQQRITESLTTLLAMMIPPSRTPVTQSGNGSRRESSAARPSSSKRTKSRSGKGG